MQFPLRPGQRGLAAVAFRDPDSGERQAVPPNTQLFGSITAALQYNCLSRIIAALAARRLKIPIAEYFDDFGLATPLPLTEDALLAFTELNRILGFELELSKSEWGQILEFLGLVIDLTPVPGNPPTLYLPQQRKDKHRTQISEVSQAGRASTAAPRKLVGRLSFAETAAVGKTARVMLRPVSIQCKSEGAARAPLPSSLRAVEWRHQALSTWGSTSLKSFNSSPDFPADTDAAGFSYFAALIFRDYSKSLKPLLSKCTVPQNAQARLAATNLIFALELFTVASAVWALANRAPNASVLIFVDNDSAPRVLAKGESNHPLINQLVGSFWFLVARESVGVWIERVGSSSNPADAPSRGKAPPVEISDENPLPSSNKALNLIPPATHNFVCGGRQTTLEKRRPLTPA